MRAFEWEQRNERSKQEPSRPRWIPNSTLDPPTRRWRLTNPLEASPKLSGPLWMTGPRFGVVAVDEDVQAALPKTASNNSVSTSEDGTCSPLNLHDQPCRPEMVSNCREVDRGAVRSSRATISVLDLVLRNH